MYVCIYIYIYMYIYIVYIYADVSVHIYIYIYTHTYVCLNTCRNDARVVSVIGVCEQKQSSEDKRYQEDYKTHCASPFSRYRCL